MNSSFFTRDKFSTVDREDLINEYVNLLTYDNATIFAGAGLSLDSGLPTWQKLMEMPIKTVLQKSGEGATYDFYDVAEKYVQSQSGRTALTNLLVNQISNYRQPSNTHKIITRLPVSRIWTTNFDTLIEKAYEYSGKKITVIRRDLDFTFSRVEDVKLYKIHGCITIPESLVITKSDVQTYEKEYEIMAKAFCTALAEDTFLFLGFSFIDPHFDAIMGLLRGRYKENTRQHYAVMKLPIEKQRHGFGSMIMNLAKYGIKVLVVESYNEIALLLKDIEKAYIRNNVFVSGSLDRQLHEKHIEKPITYTYDGNSIQIPFNGEIEKSFYIRRVVNEVKVDCNLKSPFTDKTHEAFYDVLHKLGGKILDKNLNIYTGYGLGVCDVIVDGALNEFNKQKHYHGTLDRIKILPLGLSRKVESFNSNFYRELISSCGIMIIARGGTHTSDFTSGTFEEYNIAKGLSNLLLGRLHQIHDWLRDIFDDEKNISVKSTDIDDRINSSMVVLDKIIRYQFEELAEIFYRTIYEQWKLVVRIMDLYKCRTAAIISGIEIGNNQKILEFKNSWGELEEILNDFVLDRMKLFYNLFENGEKYDTLNDSSNINSQQEGKMRIILESTTNLNQKLKDLALESDIADKLRSSFRGFFRLIQGDFKYWVVAQIMGRFTNRDLEISMEYYAGLDEVSKNKKQQYKNDESSTNEKELSKEKLKKQRDTESRSNFKFLLLDILNWEKHIRNHTTSDKYGYVIREQMNYLFDKKINDFQKLIDDSYNIADSENVSELTSETKLNSYIDSIYIKYIKKINPAIINSETENIIENIGISESEDKYSEQHLFRIQTYKLLLVLSDVIGGLQRVISDYETIKISIKKNNNDSVRNSIFFQDKGFPNHHYNLDIEADPFFFDPNRFDEYLHHQIEYIKNHYEYNVSLLKSMIDFKNIFRNCLETDPALHLNKHNSKHPKYKLKDSNQLKIQVSSVQENLLAIIEQLDKLNRGREESKRPYRSIPLRPATVIIPIASFGGMATKIWREERWRFKYLCTNKTFSHLEHNQLMYHYDNLYRIKFPRSDFNIETDENMHQIESKKRKLLESVMFIIKQFQKSSTIGAAGDK